MDALGGTASTLRLLQQCFRHVKQARQFETEFIIYQLRLEENLIRCAAISRIIRETNPIGNDLSINGIDDTNSMSQGREPTAAGILSAVQHALLRAQREAAQVGVGYLTQARITGFVDRRRVQATKTLEGVKWALYKRDSCKAFMEEISSIILHLEHKVDRERRTLVEARLVGVHGRVVVVVLPSR
ncbi:hypothetical protein V8C34DRAFT_290274 [Trichoderma compactum]